MTAILTANLTLDEFPKQQDLERSPAWEYVNGQATQKPMPKFRHSLLQKRLLKEIDDPSGHYLTLPEIRCTLNV
jgi:Uma2 family endonuclease